MTTVTNLKELDWKALNTKEKKEILWNHINFATEYATQGSRFEADNVYPLLRDVCATELSRLQDVVTMEEQAKEEGLLPEDLTYVQGALHASNCGEQRLNAMEVSIRNFIASQPNSDFSVRLVHPGTLQEFVNGDDLMLVLAGSAGVTLEEWQGNQSVSYTASASVLPQVTKYLMGKITKEALIKRTLSN